MSLLYYSSYTIISLTTLLILLVVGARRRWLSSIGDIPGPFWASTSVLWEVWNVIEGHIEEKVIALHERYGYFVRISHDEVSVSHPDAIRKILLDPLRKVDWYKIMALPDHNFQTPMSEVDPKRRVERARNTAIAYSLTNIMRSEQHIDDLIALLEKRLAELARDKKPVEFDKWFNFLAFDVIGEVTFSKAFGFLETGTDVGGSIENSRILTGYVAVVGYFQTIHRLTLGNPWIGKLGLTPSQHIFDTVRRAVTARQSNPDVRQDMLEQWMIQLKEHPDRFEENELYGVANATVGAGADTVSATLQAFWYYLLRNPTALKQLREEVDDAAARGKLSSVVSFAEARELPFLQACIKETFRMHPAVAHGLGRVVGKGGLKIGDRVFEEGTHVSVNPWVIHRSKEFFGPDAKVFNPHRWLEPRSKDMDKYMMQFGAGYNSCPGQNLARMEISKVTATLVRDFDIRQVDPAHNWSFKSHFTAVPYDWPCYVSPRAAYVG